MNEKLKQFTAELLKDFEASLAKIDVASFMQKTKADGGITVRFVVSTADLDRQGDSLNQAKWDFSRFDLNPVILWAHDYSGVPIGMGSKLITEGDKTYCDVTFTPEELNAFGAQIGRLAQAGYINATSVGYIMREDGTMELLEISLCAVPANPFALAQRQIRSMHLEIGELAMKGISFNVKADAAGDDCETEDGKAGTLSDDGSGKLVCVAKETNPTDMKLTEAMMAEHARHKEAIGAAMESMAGDADPEKAEDAAAGIEEFEKATTAEYGIHAEACMKVLDDYAAEDKKDIDEFRKGIGEEIAAHVTAMDGAIDAYKTAYAAEDGDKAKALEDMRTTVGTELDRHEKAHMEMCDAMDGGEDDGKAIHCFDCNKRLAQSEALERKTKQKGVFEMVCAECLKKGTVADELEESEERKEKYKRMDHAWNIFYAFSSAYMDENTAVGDFDKLLDEAVDLLKKYGVAEVEDEDEGEKGAVASHFKKIEGAYEKSGRTISAKTKQKLESVVELLTKFQGDSATNIETVTAAIKELIGSADGGGGEERPAPSGDQPEGKAAPKARSRSAGAVTTMGEFESYMLARNLMRTAKASIEDGLAEINKRLRDRYPDRR